MTIIDSITASANGDDVTVTGTVDGVVVQIHVWKSHLTQLGTKAAQRAYVAAQLKAAAPAAPTSVDLAGTPITI
jgi:hypothetical protein